MAIPDKVGDLSRPMSVLDVSSLPHDIFFIILSYLEPRDIIRCRRVSRSWQQAFSNPQGLSLVLRQKFPLACEVRKLRKAYGVSGGTPETGDSENERWRAAFDQVAARYFHLGNGKPLSIRKYAIWDNDPKDAYQKWFPVQPWDSHKSHLAERIDYIFEPTFWTYDDGLLVYPSDKERCILLLDLETNRSFNVPFEVEGRVVRRFRLLQRVLVIEWAEPNAFHWLNGHDGVHRHFASLFDVVPSSNSTSTNDWAVMFRNELKIMFLGHPLSDRDRFFSSHNRTHYTIYAWQPNRSLYTADEDAPIESLFVWDISKPSSYRPSEDPSGSHNHEGDGPEIVARFGFQDLEFYSVRQRGVPAMVRLEIDSEAETINIIENVCVASQQSRSLYSGTESFEWYSSVHTTSIPFAAHGPCWRREAGVDYPPYRGNSNMQTEPLMSKRGWYESVSEAADEQSQVYYSLRFFSEPWRWDMMSVLLTIDTPRSQVTLDHSTTSEIAFKGRIAGDERFVVGQNFENEIVVFGFDK